MTHIGEPGAKNYFFFYVFISGYMQTCFIGIEMKCAMSGTRRHFAATNLWTCNTSCGRGFV